MCEIENVITMGFLFVMSIVDIKKKVVPFWILLLMSISIVILRILAVEDTWHSTFGGIAIGLLFFVISKVTKEAIGYGDSWVILLIGLIKGMLCCIEIVLSASFGASIFSIIYSMINGWKRKHTVPFMPFLTAAYLGAIVL